MTKEQELEIRLASAIQMTDMLLAYILTLSLEHDCACACNGESKCGLHSMPELAKKVIDNHRQYIGEERFKSLRLDPSFVKFL